MTAYIVFIRNKSHDPEKLKKYSELSSKAPMEKLTIVASSKLGKMRVLEGPPAEAVVVLSFPSTEDALAWYNSDAYQEALPHRQAGGEYRGFLLDGAP